MALFGGFRRKHGEPETAETESEELDAEEAPLDEAASLYRAMYLNVVPAGEDVLLHDGEHTAPSVLPTFELDLLAQCTHFAPIEAHASAVARRTGLPADGVTHRLHELVDRGLLISQQEILARARAAADAHPAPTLDRVAVLTSDRPASLASCLGSYRERYGADLELVVFDDSSDAATRAENRRVAAQAGGRILYAGEDEKRRLAADLSAKSGVDPEVVAAALNEFHGCPWHCGANRNAALLDSSGDCVLMVDDDTTSRAAFPPAAGDGFRLSSRHDPMSVRFFARVEDALESASWRDTDVLAWHRRFLGRSPADCAFGQPAQAPPLGLDDGGLAFDLDDANTALIAAFARGRGRVVVTSAGVAGDSGMAPQVYFLSAQGAAREGLLEDYASHRATRAVHRSADVATISETRLLMTPHVAFDVRGTIPPFPPVLRNEDGVFGSLLRTCAPESYVAFLPWSIEHAPPVIRETEFDQVIQSVSRVVANSIIIDLARSYEPAPGVSDPAMRLRAFGGYLTALGAMAADDFDDFIRYRIATLIGGRIEQLTSAVNQNSGEPEEWAEDCAAVVTEGLRAITEGSLVVADISGASPEERNGRFQRLLSRLGRIIDAWPALLTAAVGLRAAEPVKR